MKWKLFFFCCLLFFKGIAQNPISGISISMASTMPANINDWAITMPPVTIQANIRTDSNRAVPGYVKEAKILVTIKNGSGKVCGAYTPATAPDANIQSLVKLYRGAEIEKLLGQTCTLKPGAYTLCVQFFANPNGTQKAISEEISKQFTVKGNDAETYTAPQNVSPADGKVFTEQEAKLPITFRWTPIVPRPQSDVIYKLRVFEVRKGQTATEAIKSGSPLVEKEALNQTQYCCLNFNLGGGSYAVASGSSYGWYVEATDKQGKGLGSSAVTMFSTSSTYIINLDSLKVGCPQNGTYTYSIKVGNPNSTIAIFDKLEIAVVNGTPLGTPVAIITVSPAYGTTIPAGGSITATGSFSYAGVVNDICLKGYIKEQLHPTLNAASTFTCDSLKCGCNFCSKNVEFDNDQPTVTYSGNTLNIVHPLWNMSAANLIGVKAEIIEFDRYVGDECMTCNKDASIWGNFISGTYGVPGAFAVATGGVTGNTHHTIYFLGPGLGIPFNLNISTPPLSNLSCCCDKITVTIRYTFIFKDAAGDCKYCSQIFKYNYQRGDCPKPNVGGGASLSKPIGINIEKK